MNVEREKLRLAGSGQVRPYPGSEIDRRMRKNVEWLFSLDPDRLLYDIRTAAGVDTRGAEGYGGWKSFQNHYLRAMCSIYVSYKGIDDAVAEEAKRRGLAISAGIRECQDKTAETCPAGFITPSMEKSFADRMELKRDSVYSHTNIGAVMYGVHKVMVGLLMSYELFDDENAMVGLRMIADRVRTLMEPYSQEERERMTDSRRVMDFFSEAGGIMDAFLLLYQETGNPEYYETSKFFRRSWFDDMFLKGEEKLAWGMEHSNSEMPYVEGLVDLYLLHGDEDALRIAQEYMRSSYEEHELPQGSVSGRSAFPDYQSELYNYPKRIYYHIMDTKTRRNISSGESCCAHNLNRIAKKLLTLGPDVSLMDAWERRFVNAVLSQQNIETGQFIYNLNLKNNAYKMWGYPENSFWCCYGTGAEVFSQLTEGAFYEDDTHAYACLYMPCIYTHGATGIRIIEQTNYPDDGHIDFLIEGEGKLTLGLRLPGWLKRPAVITLPDGQKKTVSEAGVIYEIEREWKDGDVLSLELPFDLHYACMPDRSEYVSLTLGPNLEVVTGPGLQTFDGNGEQLLKSLAPAGAPCTFQEEFLARESGGTHTVKPLRRVTDEVYSGYIHLNCPPEEVILDTLEFGKPESFEAHQFEAIGLERLKFQGLPAIRSTLTFFSDPGVFCFTLDSDPEKEVLLRLYLDGGDRIYIHQFSGHTVNPLFDLQVKHDGEWKTFSTKSCEADFPDEICHEDFVIPQKWTKGKDKLEIRLAARNFHEIPGVIGTLVDRIELFTVPQNSGTLETKSTGKDENGKVYLPNAQGL